MTIGGGSVCLGVYMAHAVVVHCLDGATPLLDDFPTGLGRLPFK